MSKLILNILWFIAAFIGIPLFVFLFYSILTMKPSEFATQYSGLASAMFILLAASIASASVMKSIDANKELKDRDIANEQENNLLFMIYICFKVLQYHTEVTKNIKNIQDENIFNYVKERTNNSEREWKKLLEGKYLKLFGDELYMDLSYISHEIERYSLGINEITNIPNAKIYMIEAFNKYHDIGYKLENILSLLHSKKKEYQIINNTKEK